MLATFCLYIYIFTEYPSTNFTNRYSVRSTVNRVLVDNPSITASHTGEPAAPHTGDGHQSGQPSTG